MHSRSPSRRRRLAGLASLVSVLVLLVGLLPAGIATAQDSQPQARDIDEACEEAPESDFSDRDQMRGEEQDAVDCIVYYGITKGKEDGSYGHREPVRRDQMASFIARTLITAGLERPPAEELDNAFTDDDPCGEDETRVECEQRDPTTEEHHHNINWLADLGIVEGDDDGNYNASNPVRRDQMASFINRSIEEITGDPVTTGEDFFDDQCPPAHDDNVNALASVGIVQGKEGGNYECTGHVTRGQMALFLARNADYLVEEEGVELTPIPQFDVTLETTTVRQGGEVRGTASSNREIESATVDGCGLEDHALELDEEGAFTFRIPNNQEPGACTLTFTVKTAQGETLSAERQITVEEQGTVTDAPELVGVVLAEEGEEEVTLRYSFDESVTDTVVADRFRIYSFAAEQTPATSAERTADDQVTATFPASEFASATTATVAHQAVQDDEGIFNPEGSHPLSDAELEAGETAAPDLVSVEPSVSGSSATFTFDEPAWHTAPEEGTGYHLVLADGTVKDGEQSDGDGTESHTVTFDLTAEEAEDVRRGYVDAGTVTDEDPDGDADGHDNPQQVAAVASEGRTATPDLTAITVDVENDTVTYRFDEAVDIVMGGTPSQPQGNFRIYYVDGSEAESSDASKSGQNAVVVQFGEGQVNELVVGASVDEGSVSSQATNRENRVDEIGTARSFDSGETAAPDLLAVSRSDESGPIGSTNRIVTFIFDEEAQVDDDSEFYVYEEDGSRTELPSGFESGCEQGDEPNEVDCVVNSQESGSAFEAAGQAVLGAVGHGAVSDASGSYLNYEAASIF